MTTLKQVRITRDLEKVVGITSDTIQWAWLPKSQISITDNGDNTYNIKLPTWLASNNIRRGNGRLQ